MRSMSDIDLMAFNKLSMYTCVNIFILLYFFSLMGILLKGTRALARR